jgi:hypothetical protein
MEVNLFAIVSKLRSILIGRPALTDETDMPIA